jgi:hypothetical protein
MTDETRFEEVEYDPETNLPKLRDGLFWKISDNESGYINISIVEECIYNQHSFLGIEWGSVTRYDTYEGLYGYLRETEMSDTEIQLKAEELYRKLSTLDSRKKRAASLAGIYPPKKL